MRQRLVDASPEYGAALDAYEAAPTEENWSAVTAAAAAWRGRQPGHHRHPSVEYVAAIAADAARKAGVDGRGVYGPVPCGYGGAALRRARRLVIIELSDFPLSGIARRLNINESTVRRALRGWR